MDNSEVKKRLNSINWNFDFTIDYGEDALHPFNCRKYYSYPATFIPEIPYALIEILSQKGDVVLDPFGGIGTTFMQALSLERVPYSFDINPVASTVCKTLYMLFNPSVDKEQIKNQLLQLCEGFDAAKDYTIDLSEQRKEEEIDNRLLPSAAQDGETVYRNAAGMWDVSVPAELNTANGITVSRSGHSLSFYLTGQLYEDDGAISEIL